ncbi:Tetratricopeptide-like helical [Penicillium lagena]|uniref:Tetratricopeptide-like helical n=1 Tax=Penicillium lagena TaxID=94218 RepID=UPI002540F9F8|nr:Tetratricopeptide-like helical [Penicillium lagena]KAJ5610482.1 Tetratricopeptide-like helical [Penicillium lagena]
MAGRLVRALSIRSPSLVSQSAWTPPHYPLASRHCIRAAPRWFHSTAAMVGASLELKKTLTPDLLESVHQLWFAHCEEETSLILPGQNEMQHWFKRDADFDRACVAKFRPVLESILTSEASATDILETINTASPLSWLYTLILLDQISRNCYRGSESKLVFTRFDPLANAIAIRAIEKRIVSQSPELRYRLAYRMWFTLPLMHSEELKIHEKALEQYEIMTAELEEFVDRDVDTLSEDEQKCHRVLSGQRDELKKLLNMHTEYEKRHKVIIERFGRYPHRNEAMGRSSTPEEVDYLENGGETFG